MLVLVSDGRANVALRDGDPHQDALSQARLLRLAGAGALVIDSEEGPVRLGRARALAQALGADYVRLADLPADRRSGHVSDIVVAARPGGRR